jgi:hypothetical protein
LSIKEPALLQEDWKQKQGMAMNIFKHLTRGITVTLVSCMILSATAGGAPVFSPASRNVSDQHLPTIFGTIPGGTHIKKDAAAPTSNQIQTPPATSGANVIIRDHRKPEGSQSASAPLAGSPSPKPPAPKTTEIRDHRPGGNADPCLKPHNTCSASARNTSINEFRKQRPDMIGVDGDPCFQTNSCNRTQLLESLIARARQNLDRGSCDSRITGQGCAQTNILPGGTELVLHYQHDGGPLIEADRQRLLGALQEAYNKSLGGGGIESTGANTAQRPN